MKTIVLLGVALVGSLFAMGFFHVFDAKPSPSPSSAAIPRPTATNPPICQTSIQNHPMVSHRTIARRAMTLRFDQPAGFGAMLALTQDQKAKAKALMDAQKPKLQAIRDDADRKVKALMEETQNQLRPILTKEQLQLLDDMVKLRQDQTALRQNTGQPHPE